MIIVDVSWREKWAGVFRESSKCDREVKAKTAFDPKIGKGTCH